MTSITLSVSYFEKSCFFSSYSLHHITLTENTHKGIDLTGIQRLIYLHTYIFSRNLNSYELKINIHDQM